MNPPSPHEPGNMGVELAAGDWRLVLRPDLGGCIAGAWWRGLPVLRSTEAAQLPRARLSGMYPLVPYSNRIGQGQLQWQGQTHALALNAPPEPHALHGCGWQRAWRAQAVTATGLQLVLQHTPDADWPFAFTAVQFIELRAGQVQLAMLLRNDHPEPAPIGLGWHPYFVKRPGARLAFDASGRWDMDEGKLPTARHAHPGLDRLCDDLVVDHCFDGWGGSASLHDDELHTELHADTSRLVVFTQPDRDFVAIEPVSHVNNALQLAAASHASLEALGLQVLAPGAKCSARMRIECRAAS